MIVTNPTPQNKAVLCGLWQQAFGDSPDFFETFYRTAFAPERCLCLWAGETLAAALYWLDCSCKGEKIAYIYGVATAGEYRGQGYCRRLMEATHKRLTEQGYAAAMLVPVSKDLFGMYEKFGYRPCTQVAEFTALPQGPRLTLTPVSPKEYGELRREMLPAGTVWQEGENLTFLAAQATLYRGDGLLMAVQQTKENLWAMEFLGEAALAPRVLKTLGAPRGKFRTHGMGRPFTMILPFRPVSPPDYFAFAFD